ncbi:helix-turn-helix domain-containing protein [Streptacidiphilus sp. EB129]|uniref:helix-turn-helix domain-containing protein n=1 Tax=Streptacidiphilus sp. EB129 TaxID=3156262 RepID=UPI003516458C
MSDTTSGGAGKGTAPHPGDIGRRVALRRRELGLSREEVAARAGMAPTYLQYLETRPGEIDVSGLLRLAGALNTTLSELLGGSADLPPGRAGAKGKPVLEELGTQECWARLSERGVGRLGFSTAEGPVVLPVNYQVMDRGIVYRTAPGTVPAAAVGHRVAFEVDHIDDALSQGWSVLVVGHAQARPAAPDDGGNAGPDPSPPPAGPTPWAGGQRDLWVRISPDTLTGRIIRS